MANTYLALKPAVDSISPKTKVFDMKRNMQMSHANNSDGLPQLASREREHQSAVKSRSPIRKSSTNDNRARAKVFIRVLHDHGYTFTDLAKEDLDVSILKDLYTELGISPGPSNKAPPNLSLPPRPKSPQTVEKLTQPQKQSSISQSQLTQSNDGLQETKKIASNKSTQPTIVSHDSKREQPSVEPSQKAQSIDKAQPLISNKDNSKAKEAKPEEPALERKDYIAMLLAAKNQKSSSAPTLPKKPADTANVAKKVNVADSAEAKSTESPRELQEKESKDDVAEKKRIQTELAKQRIEALAASKNKGQISGKEQPSTPTLEPTKLLSKPSAQDISKATTKVSEVSSGVQDVEPNFEVSNISSTSNAIPDSETNGPSAPSDNPESQNGQGISDTTQSTQSTSLSKDSRGNSMSKNSIPGLFMTVEGTPSTKGEVRLALPIGTPDSRSKKRPVAADFDDFNFQPPTKTLKRPFGSGFNSSLDDEEMIIHVSEDESSGSESEGEIITDKSQSIGPSDSRNSQPNSQALRKEMPPLSDVPRRTLITKRLSCYSSSGRISPSGTQSPGSSVALEKTEEQISTIRKRIAQLEQRKKHKLAVIQAENPSETTASLEKMVEMMVQENDIKPSSKAVTEQSGQVHSHSELSTKASASAEVQQSKSELTRAEELHEIASPGEPNFETQNSQNKYQRKDELQKTLSNSDAAVALTKTQLDQLKKDVENAEMKLQDQILQKEKLAKEFEALSVISLPVPKAAIDMHQESNDTAPEEPRNNGNI